MRHHHFFDARRSHGRPSRHGSTRRKRLRERPGATRLQGEPLESRWLLAIMADVSQQTEQLVVPLVAEEPAMVVGQYLFYNESAFDGFQAAANPLDDSAIAFDKQALIPGETATFANYSSYSNGINGLMVDIAGLFDPEGLSESDFDFRVGRSSDVAVWEPVDTTADITVRVGEGINESDRVTIIWPNGAIHDQWLQVTVKASPVTGLKRSETFYFGNLIGESGNVANEAVVDADDEAGARANPHTLLNPADIDDAYDFNRDRQVNATDRVIARHNFGALELIVAPEASEAEVTIVAHRPVGAVGGLRRILAGGDSIR